MAGAGDRHGWVRYRWTKPRYRRCDHASAEDTEGQGRHALASSVLRQLPQAATDGESNSIDCLPPRLVSPRTDTDTTHLTPSRHAALVLSSSCCCTLPVNALTPESGRAPGGRDMMKSIEMNQFSFSHFNSKIDSQSKLSETGLDTRCAGS